METPLSPSTSEPEIHPAETLFLKYRHFIFFVLIASLSAGFYLMLTPPTTTLAKDADAIPTQATSENVNSQDSDTAQIVVDIAGAIAKPGVYFLNSQSIVEDAVMAAGGFSTTADLDAIAKSINRAERIEAHSKIYIPKHGDNISSIATTGFSTKSNSTFTTSKININTATTTELDILPGIGPVTAQRIIDHRLENGDYKTIEQIKDVPGISDAKFDQLKNLITIS